MYSFSAGGRTKVRAHPSSPEARGNHPIVGPEQGKIYQARQSVCAKMNGARQTVFLLQTGYKYVCIVILRTRPCGLALFHSGRTCAATVVQEKSQSMFFFATALPNASMWCWCCCKCLGGLWGIHLGHDVAGEQVRRDGRGAARQRSGAPFLSYSSSLHSLVIGVICGRRRHPCTFRFTAEIPGGNCRKDELLHSSLFVCRLRVASQLHGFRVAIRSTNPRN